MITSIKISQTRHFDIPSSSISSLGPWLKTSGSSLGGAVGGARANGASVVSEIDKDRGPRVDGASVVSEKDKEGGARVNGASVVSEIDKG